MSSTTTSTTPTTSTTTTGAGPGGGWRRAVRHYLEMVAAMVVGMLVLGGLQSTLLGLLGVRAGFGVEVEVLLMATHMAIGMAAWMRHRGHRWLPVLEMCAAMYVPFLALFVPLWAGALSADGLMLWGHVLMLLAMVVPMLLRPAEYTTHVRHDLARPRRG